MQIHRARADCAASRKGYVSLTEPRHQRTQHEDRRSHGFDELVRRFQIIDLARVNFDTEPVIDSDLHAHRLQQSDGCRHVPEMRDITDSDGLTGQQRASQNWQCRILGARY